MKRTSSKQNNQTNRLGSAVSPTARSAQRRIILAFGGLAIAGTVLGACTSSSPKPTTQPTVETAPVSANSTPDPAEATLTVAIENATTVATDSAVAAPSPASTETAPTKVVIPGGAVLPVPSNPITNTASAQTLKIDSVLVENNVDAKGKGTSDHLEIALSNTGTTDATEIEVFYTFTDTTAATTENYYTKLPADFTVPAGGKRIIHFDDTGAPDHFPVNKFSLYYISKNAIDVSVTVSAKDAAVQKLELKKDAGGAEAAD
jgi:hypothetical protein